MQSAARRLHATAAIAATRVQQEPLGYLSATNSNNTVAADYISDGCLAIPAASAAQPLVTLAVPDTTAAQLLPRIQGARALRSIAVQGGQPYLLYAISPGSVISGEQPIAASAAHGQPQPVGFAYTPAAQSGAALTIRWSGAPDLQRANASSAVSYWYGAIPGGAPIADYTFTAQALDAQSQPVGAPITTVCSRLAWSPQMGLITTTRLPTALATGGQVAAWRVSAQIAPAVATRPTLGPLALETGAITFGPSRPLTRPITFAAPLP